MRSSAGSEQGAAYEVARARHLPRLLQVLSPEQGAALGGGCAQSAGLLRAAAERSRRNPEQGCLGRLAAA